MRSSDVQPGVFSVNVLPGGDRHPHESVVDVSGEVDLVTAPVLREVLESILEHQTGSVVVDLSNVTFMDSTGVHVLVCASERLRAENRRLATACREGGQVQRVLAILGLLDALAVYNPPERTGD